MNAASNPRIKSDNLEYSILENNQMISIFEYCLSQNHTYNNDPVL